jgi:hypothetical protein
MNTSATFWSLKSVKWDGGGVLEIWTTQGNFEVILEVWECVQSPKAGVMWIVNRTLNICNNWKCSCQIWGRKCGTRCAQAAIWGGPFIIQSCLLCCGVAAVYMITKRICKMMCSHCWFAPWSTSAKFRSAEMLTVNILNSMCYKSFCVLQILTSSLLYKEYALYISVCIHFLRLAVYVQ